MFLIQTLPDRTALLTVVGDHPLLYTAQSPKQKWLTHRQNTEACPLFKKSTRLSFCAKVTSSHVISITLRIAIVKGYKSESR